MCAILLEINIFQLYLPYNSLLLQNKSNYHGHISVNCSGQANNEIPDLYYKVQLIDEK